MICRKENIIYTDTKRNFYTLGEKGFGRFAILVFVKIVFENMNTYIRQQNMIKFQIRVQIRNISISKYFYEVLTVNVDTCRCYKHIQIISS